jgi:dynactin complex subunit
MLRKLAVSLAFVVGLILLAGCDVAKNVSEAKKDLGDKAKEAADKAKEGGDKAIDKAKEAGEKIKDEAKEAKAKLEEAVVKPISDGIPKIEEKIKGMSGEKADEAKQKLADLKKSLEEFKTFDAAKMADAKDKILKSFEDLKKMVGL